jgi:hypothetical protein
MSKKADMQRLIRAYKDETGEREVDMHKVAIWAVAKGWPLPKPQNPYDVIAKELSDAARVEIKYDKETGNPYRVNHAIVVRQGDTQLHLWIDIDEAERGPMLKSLINRREQMIGDGLQLTFDMDHWNAANPSKEPIEIPMDLTLDIEWRKNGREDDKDSG